MLQHELTKKMLLLLFAVIFVLGFFFLQQQHIVSKSAPQPTPTPIMASSGNIIVTSPYKDASIGTSFIIKGKARVFENVVSIRVSNKVLGKIYYVGQTLADAPDAGMFGDFAAQIKLNTKDFSLRPNDKLTLEVFQSSAKDGSDIDVVTIPLYFSPELP
jgi:hypothetical protein